MYYKEIPNTIKYRTAKSHAMKILLLLVLMSESTKASGVTNIDLRITRILKLNLRKAKGKGGKTKI